MSTNLDLLEHYALNAEELDGPVIHKCFVSDPPRGLRKVEVKEIWDNVRIVGHGSFGEVWLQKRRDFEAKRAVKVLRRYQMQYSNVDYKRELEALAKFDKS
jgi:serine/threonine protein kinase